jgi:serine phosphatase RsbU (regulator of sigma subunit)
VTLRKSTRNWLAVLAAAIVLLAIDGSSDRLGVLGGLAGLAALVACFVLFFRAVAALFRLIVRRLTLRLAFSYFLIGIVPIPLLALLLAATGYVLAFQFVGGRLKREIVAVAEETSEKTPGVRAVEIRDGKILRSPFAALAVGAPAPWAASAETPRLLVEEDQIWLARDALPAGNGTIHFLSLEDRGVLQRIADRTGYVVQVEQGEESRRGRGMQIEVGDRPDPADKDTDDEDAAVRPRARPEPGKTWRDKELIIGIYMARPVGSTTAKKADSESIVTVIGHTSPRLLYEELFSNWVPGAGRIVVGVILGLALSLLFVYLVALGLAFALVATIARNVNKMTRAAGAIQSGNFSVRVNSKSRDQIGDLARSFDGMASSIERLMVETARKERLEAEIAVARTIQQKLLPPPEAQLEGVRIVAHVQSVAEIGGDYYDYLPTPDGRLAVVVGDVSGHGLPTGLLVAMAKAALATLIETGYTGSRLFARLNDLIHRSTDSRSYMTLALLVYDTASRRGELTNAGQLAPYRISGATVESLSLPSYPLGITERPEFPTKAWEFSSGDRLVFLTDGLVECVSPTGEPFGFELLEAILSREAAADATALRAAILTEVEKWTGGAPSDDDRTLVIVTLDEG